MSVLKNYVLCVLNYFVCLIFVVLEKYKKFLLLNENFLIYGSRESKFISLSHSDVKLCT